MLKKESVATAKGPQALEKGQVYELENWMADSIVGRGYGTIIEGTITQSASQSLNMKDANIGQLRELGRQYNIPDYRTLSKSELTKALEGVAISAPPPPEPFEPLGNSPRKK